MHSNAQWFASLEKFAGACDLSKSFLALDLDGTALLEDHGKVFISSSVEKGVKALHDLNIPVVLNTLRFPLSVMRTAGQEWYQIADAPILTVVLNGSVRGSIKCADGDLVYEEIAVYPLSHDEITTTMQGVAQLTKAGIDEVLLFIYARDWKAGETLWTPNPDKIPDLRNKYVSTSKVFSSSIEQLSDELLRRE